MDFAEFAPPLETGMRRVPTTTLDTATARRLQARLDEFDAVRNRGAVEARNVYFRRPSCS